MYYAYVLVSDSTGKRYTGHTDNLERRIEQHNDQQHNLSKYTTRNSGPWRLVHFEKFATRSEAMAREKWLKSGVGRAWLDEHVGRAGPPKAD